MRRGALGTALAIVVGASTFAAGGVAADAASVRPALPGASVPPLTVRDAEAEEIDLAALLGDKPTLLVLYRGGW